MQNFKRWIPVLAIAPLLLVSGCGDDDRAEEGTSVTANNSGAPVTSAPGTMATDMAASPAPATGANAERNADAAAERIEDLLEADATLKSFDLEADEEDNRVVLKGEVKTADQKTLAEEIARQNANGQQILSKITVDPD